MDNVEGKLGATADTEIGNAALVAPSTHSIQLPTNSLIAEPQNKKLEADVQTERNVNSLLSTIDNKPTCQPGNATPAIPSAQPSNDLAQRMLSSNDLAASTRPEIEHQRLDTEKGLTKLSYIRICLEVLMFLAIFGTLIATYKQWEAMYETLVEMRRQTPGILDAGIAARDSVNQQRESLRLARTESENSSKENRKALAETLAQGKAALDATVESARNDQRAWVGVDSNTLPECIEAGGPVFVAEGCRSRIGFNIRNSGKTIARKYTLIAKGAIQPVEAKFVPDFEEVRSPSVTVLQPGMRVSTYLAEFTRPMDSNRIQTLKSGQAVLYVYGRISYEDVFGVSRWATFCQHLDRELNVFVNCPFYNDAN